MIRFYKFWQLAVKSIRTNFDAISLQTVWRTYSIYKVWYDLIVCNEDNRWPHGRGTEFLTPPIGGYRYGFTPVIKTKIRAQNESTPVFVLFLTFRVFQMGHTVYQINAYTLRKLRNGIKHILNTCNSNKWPLSKKIAISFLLLGQKNLCVVIDWPHYWSSFSKLSI